MKAVVTGATGFVGRCLVKELLVQGDEVAVIVRDSARLPEEWRKDVDIVEASLASLPEVTLADFAGKADIFYHLAWTGTAGTERGNTVLQLENVQAACEAVRLAGRIGCRTFINAGSIMEYEAMQYIPLAGAAPGMGNIYSTAKLAADFMAKTVAINEGVDYRNAIISNIYGAGERSPRFFNTTLRRMLRNEDVPLTHGRQYYDFIYVSDAAKAIVLAAKSTERNASVYIGNSVCRPLREFVVEMREILGSSSKLLFGAVEFGGAMLTYQEFDTTKLEGMGFVPEITFETGVKMVRDGILGEGI